MIRVILWDVDGTLLDFKKAERGSLQTCFKTFDLGPCPEDRVARYSALNDSFWKRLERGEITKAELLPGRFEVFFKQEGIVFDQYDAFNKAYQRQLGEQIFFLEHSRDLLAKLKQTGQVRQYAVTNGTKAAQDRKLEKSGLGVLFDRVFISEEVGAEKPSPAFFETVWKTIGPVPKDEVLIVGDSLTSDMKGGSQEGIVCAWYNPSGAPMPPELDLTYDLRSLWEVESIVLGSHM